MKRARFLLLGGPGYLLPGCARTISSAQEVAGKFANQRTTSCGLRPPGQHTHAWRCRATRKIASRVLFCLILALASESRAQTNTADLSAPATNAPAYFAPPLNLSNSPDQTPPADSLYDIRPPFFFLHSWFWFWIALGIASAVALLVLLWFWLRPHRQLSSKSAYELALEKLEKARALLREDNPMPYAVLVSETIRSYLGQRFQAPSTRRTTEEFLRQMEADRSTPLAEHRDLLRDFLQSCDLVKFARYQPTLTELEQVQQRATNFVTATKPLPESIR